MRFLFLLICLLLYACVSQVEKPQKSIPASSHAIQTNDPELTIGTSRPPTAQEQEFIQELMKETERIRGLNFIKPVPVFIQDRTAITAYMESQINDEDLEHTQLIYTALGLLDPGVDLKELLLRVLEEQIAGYYDPKKRQLVIRDDIMGTMKRGDHGTIQHLDEARIALVHELVHALQSQHLSLSENIDVEREIDAENAYRALFEGDATLAMIGYALQTQLGWSLDKITENPEWILSQSQLLEASPLIGDELASAPPIIRIPLLFAYTNGLNFAVELHGKEGWSTLNTVYKSPPISTEQILHPKRFSQGEVPDRIEIPNLPVLTESGYEIVEENTVGELEMGIYFGQAIPVEAARRAAQGWGGDRLRIYRSKTGDIAVIWFTNWDTEAEAMEAEEAAMRVLEQVSTSQRKRYCVTKKKRSVLIIRELPSQLHGELIHALDDLSQRMNEEELN